MNLKILNEDNSNSLLRKMTEERLISRMNKKVELVDGTITTYMDIINSDDDIHNFVFNPMVNSRNITFKRVLKVFHLRKYKYFNGSEVPESFDEALKKIKKQEDRDNLCKLVKDIRVNRTHNNVSTLGFNAGVAI